jgi:hypothetical protein
MSLESLAFSVIWYMSIMITSLLFVWIFNRCCIIKINIKILWSSIIFITLSMCIYYVPVWFNHDVAYVCELLWSSGLTIVCAIIIDHFDSYNYFLLFTSVNTIIYGVLGLYLCSLVMHYIFILFFLSFIVLMLCSCCCYAIESASI